MSQPLAGGAQETLHLVPYPLQQLPSGGPQLMLCQLAGQLGKPGAATTPSERL